MSTFAVHTCSECGKKEVVDGQNHNWGIIYDKLICPDCLPKQYSFSIIIN